MITLHFEIDVREKNGQKLDKKKKKYANDVSFIGTSNLLTVTNRSHARAGTPAAKTAWKYCN